MLYFADKTKTMIIHMEQFIMAVTRTRTHSTHTQCGSRSNHKLSHSRHYYHELQRNECHFLWNDFIYRLSLSLSSKANSAGNEMLMRWQRALPLYIHCESPCKQYINPWCDAVNANALQCTMRAAHTHIFHLLILQINWCAHVHIATINIGFIRKNQHHGDNKYSDYFCQRWK